MDNDEALAELGIFYLGVDWEIAPYIMAEKHNAQGAGIDLSVSWQDFDLNGNYRRLWNNQNTRDSDNDLPLVGVGFEQFSSTLNYPLLGGSGGYRYSYNKRPVDTVESHSINWRKQLWRTQDYDLDTDISWSRSGDNQIGLFSLTLRYRQDRWDFRASPTLQINKNPNGTTRLKRTRLTAGWSDGDLLDADVTFNSGIDISKEQKRIDGQLRYSDHLGSANVGLAHARTGNSQITSYSLNMGTSLMTDGSVFSVGGKGRAQSAVVINIDGREGDRFDVLVDGQRITYAVVGQPSVVGLSPFRQYQISVRPAGTAMYGFDEKTETVTLYPGNVVRLDVETVALQLAFGRIMFNGTAGKNARITGGMTPISVDDYGLFQVEMPLTTESLNIEMDNGWLCKVPLPEEREDNILRLGTINLSEAQCQPILEGQLAVGKVEE